MATFVYDGQKVNVKFIENQFGIWQYNASCKGKRFRKSTKERDLESAEEFFQKDLENIIKKARGTEDVILSFEGVWEVFLKKPRAVPLREDNKKTKYTRFSDFVDYAKSIGVTSVYDITRKISEGYIQYMRNNGRFSKKTYSPTSFSIATKNIYLFTLKEIFNSVVNEEQLRFNPFANIPALRGAGNDIEKEIFTIEEIEMIINSPIAQKHYLYPILILAPHTGMRKSDICLLKSSSVNFEENTITYKPIKTKIHGTVAEVPIREEIKDFMLKQDYSNKSVFPELEKRYRANRGSGMSADFKKLMKTFGIKTQKKIIGRSKKVSIKGIHSFRHTYVYMCAIANVPTAVIQKQVGHMDSRMTKLYSDHVSSADNQRFGKLVTASLKAKKETKPDKKKDLIEKLMSLDEEALEQLLSKSA